MIRRTCIAILLTIFLLVPSLGQAEVRAEQGAPRCYIQTGYCIQGRFLDYWEFHGGLAVNGYPISEEFTQVLEDRKSYLVQYFERARFEYHPENDDLSQVLLGQFGRRIYGTDPHVQPIPDRYFFEETGHTVGPRFLRYWRENGGLAQFGYPISELFWQTLEDGKQYQVQIFERARFENHPENPEPYDVLLGQFGRAVLAESRASYPILLAPCTNGWILIEKRGTVASTDPGPDRPYECEFRLPLVDPSTGAWKRLFTQVNVNLYEKSVSGWKLVKPDENGIVQLRGNGVYLVQGLKSGSWFTLSVVRAS